MTSPGDQYRFSIVVFKNGTNASDYTLSGIQVPESGRLAWSGWRALDKELLPGVGNFIALKTYGPNVVLRYFVEAKEGDSRPVLPGGFILIDSALSDLTDVAVTDVEAEKEAPLNEVDLTPASGHRSTKTAVKGAEILYEELVTSYCKGVLLADRERGCSMMKTLLAGGLTPQEADSISFSLAADAILDS